MPTPKSDKERKREFKRRMEAVLLKKQHARMFNEIVVCPDKLMVKLRDSMLGAGQISQAQMVDALRELRIRGEPIPPPPN